MWHTVLHCKIQSISSDYFGQQPQCIVQRNVYLFEVLCIVQLGFFWIRIQKTASFYLSTVLYTMPSIRSDPQYLADILIRIIAHARIQSACT